MKTFSKLFTKNVFLDDKMQHVHQRGFLKEIDTPNPKSTIPIRSASRSKHHDFVQSTIFYPSTQVLLK